MIQASTNSNLAFKSPVRIMLNWLTIQYRNYRTSEYPATLCFNGDWYILAHSRASYCKIHEYHAAAIFLWSPISYSCRMWRFITWCNYSNFRKFNRKDYEADGLDIVHIFHWYFTKREPCRIGVGWVGVGVGMDISGFSVFNPASSKPTH